MNITNNHFKTEAELLKFANKLLSYSDAVIISIVKDVTNGDWIIFYRH